MNSIRYIFQRIEASEADMVINFYELLTGFTTYCFALGASGVYRTSIFVSS